MIKFKKDKSGKSGTIKVEGEIKIENAEEMKAVFLSSLKSVEHLKLDAEGVTEVDLSFLQLMCSAHSTAVKTGKDIKLSTPLPSAVADIARLSGFDSSPCSLVPSREGCFWKKGATDE